MCQGIDVLTGGAFCFDPFAAYTNGLITSPNILVIGEVGAGKSAATKTFIARSVGLLGSPGGLGRWVSIVDPKGEYAGLARVLGLQVLKIHPGGAVRLNPLDRGPFEESAENLAGRRASMVSALCSSVLRRELVPIEDAVVGLATVALGQLTEPTLIDLYQLVRNPTEDMASSAGVSAAELRREVQDLTFALGKLLDRDLRGMFDGPSTERIDWSGRGLVLDLSAVYHDQRLLQLVFVAASSWLQSYLAHHGGKDVPRRAQVFEEAWAVLADLFAARYIQG
jgi:type IV secretory pathway VirB4 component